MNKHIDITGVMLTTDRLTLRPWRESDLNDFHKYASMDGVGQMAGWNPHRSIEETRKILSHFLKEKNVFALEHCGKVIGSLGVHGYNEAQYPELQDQTGIEIGYVLSKDYWGQGLMPEAVQAVIGWLFQEIKLDFIICGHFVQNDRSRRVIEKCGFRYVKTVPFETRLRTVETAMDYLLRRDEYADT